MATTKIGGRPAIEVAGGPKIEDLLSTSGALHVNIKAIPLTGIGVYAIGSRYVAGSVALNNTDFVLGATGATGDLLEEVVIRNADGTGTVTVTVKDNTTALDAYTVAVAPGASTRIVVGLLSANGAWKLNCNISAGTITNVKYLANGLFT